MIFVHHIIQLIIIQPHVKNIHSIFVVSNIRIYHVLKICVGQEKVTLTKTIMACHVEIYSEHIQSRDTPIDVKKGGTN